MPAPVSFVITLAPFPVNFAGTAQEWGTAIADRLTITPSEPWSSFQNGGSIPLSDVGPVLFEGMEWRVFDTGTGLYTFHRQNGAGLVDETVTNAKLADGTAGAIQIFDGSGRPAELPATGADGQVVTKVGSGFALAETFAPAKYYFESTVSTDQDINTNGSVQIVEFDTVKHSANVGYDTGLFRAAVEGPTVWFCWLNLEVEDTVAASTDVQMQAVVRLNGTATDFGVSFQSAATGNLRFPMTTMGLLVVPTAGYLDVAVTADEATPAADGLAIIGNATNTRFGGFRII
jgi:hypothetical protein